MERFGEYVLLKRLGQGAGGTVDLARRLDDAFGEGKLLVVKRLHPALTENKNFLLRFRHEALVAISVQSTNVASIYDVGAVGDTPYIAMEYVEGERLIDVMRGMALRDELAPLRIVTGIVAGGLRGLSAVHEAVHPKTGEPLGAVHRDVSPNNMMLSYRGRLMLIDLGLGSSNVQDWQTRTGAVLGSPGYIAPEQVVGERVDHRADLFSLGVIFYELLALEPYVKRGDRQVMLRRMENARKVKPSEWRADIPPEIDRLIADTLAQKADDRPSSATEILDRLVEVVGAATDDEISEFLTRLVGPDRIEEMSRVRALLDMPMDLGDSEQPPELTTVYARRASELDTLGESDTRPLVPRPELEPEPDPTVDLEAPRRGVPVPVALGLLIATGAATVALSRFAGDEPAEPPVPPPPPTPAKVVAKARPSVAPVSPPPPPAAPPVPPPAAPPPRRRTAPRKVRPSPPPSKPVRVADATTVRQEVRRLTQRSARLMAKHPERSSEIERILADISAWSASTDYPRAMEELRKLDRKLTRIR